MRFFPHVPKLTAKVVRKLFKLVTGRPEEITSLNVKFVGHSKIITVHCTKTRFWVEGYFQLSLDRKIRVASNTAKLRGSKVISERQTRSSIQGCLKCIFGGNKKRNSQAGFLKTLKQRILSSTRVLL
jgi:hypothetical protein